MKFRLRDKPLAIQIWVIIGLVFGLAFLMTMIAIPQVLRIVFTNEIYARLEDSQEVLLKEEVNLLDISRRPPPDKFEPRPNAHFRVVRHLIYDPTDVNALKGSPEEWALPILDEALQQKEKRERYARKLDNTLVMYVISKVEVQGKDVYLISYLWERYRDNLVRVIFSNLLIIFIFVLIVSWIASSKIARLLTRPLVKLQHRVKEIAERKWEEPVILDRKDELGDLGEAIDSMRRQLMEHNKNQQAFLQKVSHELKTPIMVIRSYAQSIQDGILPKGSLAESIQVIEGETERLEQRVQSLLHLSKLEYLLTQQLEVKSFQITELLETVVERFSWRRTELRWNLDLENCTLRADPDKLTVVLENILDNQLRYAKQLIQIGLTRIRVQGQQMVRIRIWNDGPALEEDIREHLFDRFKKGKNGEFGLGLAIVKVIIDMHQGQIWAVNEADGVAFYLQLPVV